MYSMVKRLGRGRELSGRSHRLRLVGGALALAAVGLVVVADPASASSAAATTASGAAHTTSAAAARPTLKQGARGDAVVVLQYRLTALHYDVGGVDGVFGGDTFHAVVAFQKVNNLGRDGVVGPATWARLDNPLVPRPHFSHTGYSVEVNLTKQVVYLARANSIVRIVDASSGKPSTPTPTGNFAVNRRINGWRQSSLGLLWRPNYFYQGFALHGSTSVPNYPASHGCVRTTINATNRLWGIIGIGTPVHLYRP
jgi:peptidoglycan hydrolase-like protein with peptidoglycan-binding domain